jgi:phosphoribosyl 1,2-cyclic phosphodiesterase
MQVRFFGTRGTVPVPDPECAQFGGNTSCVMIIGDGGRVAILDAGTGIRKAGRWLVDRGIAQRDDLTICLSHTHWDHIQGFPFFGPAYDPRQNLTIAINGRAAAHVDLEQVFTTQMQQDFFPVPLSGMGATIRFWQPSPTDLEARFGDSVRTLHHAHPGTAYSYRLADAAGHSVVYCTDIEHGKRIDPRVVELASGADLLIHDAQYTPAELEKKRGWGHSSWEQAVEVGLAAKVKRLALFHHDPEHDDAFLHGVEREAQRLFSNAFLAREGLEVAL